MADERLSQKDELTTVSQSDYLPIVHDGQMWRVTQKNLLGVPDNGWLSAGETWTYSSATVITVPTGAQNKYIKGMRVRFAQTTGGTKYGEIIDRTTTTLTVSLQNGATLSNEAITTPMYSADYAPFGYAPPTIGELGYAQRTSSFTMTSTTNVAVTSLSVSVYIPAGTKAVKITAWAGFIDNSTSAFNNVSLWDGTIGSGTKLADISILVNASVHQIPMDLIARVTPTAGTTKTYNVAMNVTAGTGQIYASTTSPAFLLVEAI